MGIMEKLLFRVQGLGLGVWGSSEGWYKKSCKPQLPQTVGSMVF